MNDLSGFEIYTRNTPYEMMWREIYDAERYKKVRDRLPIRTTLLIE